MNREPDGFTVQVKQNAFDAQLYGFIVCSISLSPFTLRSNSPLLNISVVVSPLVIIILTQKSMRL